MNMSTESSIETETRAGAWLAKRESGRWSAEDQARLTQWLNASIANRVAYLRQEAAWEYALRLQALKGTTPHGKVPTPEDWKLTPFFSDGQPETGPPVTRRDRPGNFETPDTGAAGGGDGDSRESKAEETASEIRAQIPSKKHLALAASVLVTLTAGFAWHFWPRGPVYTTPVGGIASVPIRDGSKVTLNTASEIRVAITEKERRVDLRKGEAFFEVVPDPARPFVVSAGDKRIVVLGTKFSVKRDRNDVRVVVTEGAVKVVSASELLSRGKLIDRNNDIGNVDTVVAAGGVARTSAAGLIVQNDVLTQVNDYLSWREGFLVFRDIPLGAAVAEFNRYNEQQIAIQDPAVAALRFSGKIRPASFEPFIRLLEDSFPIKAQREHGRILLTVAQ